MRLAPGGVVGFGLETMCGEMPVSHSLFCMSKSVVGATDRRLPKMSTDGEMEEKKVMAYF
jgi:hypothetical protein